MFVAHQPWQCKSHWTKVCYSILSSAGNCITVWLLCSWRECVGRLKMKVCTMSVFAPYKSTLCIKDMEIITLYVHVKEIAYLLPDSWSSCYVKSPQGFECKALEIYPSAQKVQHKLSSPLLITFECLYLHCANLFPFPCVCCTASLLSW